MNDKAVWQARELVYALWQELGLVSAGDDRPPGRASEPAKDTRLNDDTSIDAAPSPRHAHAV